MNFHPHFCHRFVGASLVCLSLISQSYADANKKNNNAQQERRDTQKVDAARQDVSEAEKKFKADAKELDGAAAEVRKAQVNLTEAKKNLDAVNPQTERTLGDKLGIPAAVEEQRKAQLAYEQYSKPLIASMRTNPKYAALAQRAEAAEKSLKELAANSELDIAAKQSLQSAASKELSDWRYAIDNFLSASTDIKPHKDRLTAAQTKLTELRSQMKKQFDNHPDPRKAEKQYTQAKADKDKAEKQLAALQQKLGNERNKIAAEKAQLSKAIMQDKKNDQNNRNNKNNNNKNNKKK
jgi:hypothetical protein